MKLFKTKSVFILLLAAVMLLCACNQEQEVSIAESDVSSQEPDRTSNADDTPATPWDEGIVKLAVNRSDLFYTVIKGYGQELHLKHGSDDTVLLAAVEFDAIIPSPDGSKVLFSADDEIHIYYYDTQKLWQEEIYGLPDGFLPKRVVWLDSENYIFTAHSEKELGGGKIYRASTGGGEQLASPCISTWSSNLHIEDMTSDGEVLTVKAFDFDEGFASHEVLYYIIPLNKVRPHGITLTPENAVTAESYAKVHTVDCAEIVATPDEIKAVTGGREYSYEKLIAMTPDEIRKEIFEPAEEHYRNFTGLGSIFGGESITVNLKHKSGEIEKWYFAVCNDERFPTYEAFIAETRKYFSKDLAVKYLYDEEYPSFACYNGVFVYTDAARGSDHSYISTEYSIESHGEDEIVYLAAAKYIKDEFYDIVENDEATDEQCYFEEYRYRFVLEDGRWVFESFGLPY